MTIILRQNQQPRDPSPSGCSVPFTGTLGSNQSLSLSDYRRGPHVSNLGHASVEARPRPVVPLILIIQPQFPRNILKFAHAPAGLDEPALAASFGRRAATCQPFVPLQPDSADGGSARRRREVRRFCVKFVAERKSFRLPDFHETSGCLQPQPRIIFLQRQSQIPFRKRQPESRSMNRHAGLESDSVTSARRAHILPEPAERPFRSSARDGSGARPLLGLYTVLIIILLNGHVASDETSGKPPKKAAEVLKPFNFLVGSWRGTGQPRRGSSRGAWQEKASCEWSFDNKRASVVLKSDGGKQFQQLQLSWDAKTGQLVLRQSQGEDQREYRGPVPKPDADRIQLVTADDTDGVSWRCTIQKLSDIRSTVLFERRSSPTGSFRRVAGIGYTRSGSRLAVAGGNQRKCVVTGGLGTIPVNYKGKTYYVCCQGCVQAFNESPDEIIAEYRASLKKE